MIVSVRRGQASALPLINWFSVKCEKPLKMLMLNANSIHLMVLIILFQFVHSAWQTAMAIAIIFLLPQKPPDSGTNGAMIILYDVFQCSLHRGNDDHIALHEQKQVKPNFSMQMESTPCWTLVRPRSLPTRWRRASSTTPATRTARQRSSTSPARRQRAAPFCHLIRFGL